ncbi:ThiF family adenylyltransferase [Liquorilactobacillus satsumensis]|uniref:ThiF family adenylyltransferase n=1 Tax=Liquorilactobacillus TaxID=2767888 RepID=UPI0021C2CF4B|nr:ThiF family adenylyltransferase [Liquorilactobacillus satsumensis]MCP9313966.1 ThiF family adenylyltransferase [Liquorilactobacillus satsumensis]MCP9361106.1 ThiF family adenylyltransferase [Liquorilactobacillus satsumensis]
MDKADAFIEILKREKAFSSIKKSEKERAYFITFKYNKKFEFTYIILKDIDYDYTAYMPYVVVNNDSDDSPHFLTRPMDLYGKKYKGVCLYEKIMNVFSEKNFEEKTEFLLSQLIKLLTLSKREREIEFQNEFLYYWNSNANIDFYPKVFVDPQNEFESLNYFLKNGTYRVASKDIVFNDLKQWKLMGNVGFLIKVENKEGIIPPVNKKWSVREILLILENPDHDRISSFVYQKLKKIEIRKKKIDLFFSIPYEENRRLIFGCRIMFKNAGVKSFFEKLQTDVESLNIFRSSREDFSYLNECIGNKDSRKRVGIVGLGSLGSYVAKELVNSGVRTEFLFDDDKLQSENLFRHSLNYVYEGYSKSKCLKYCLENMHPEVNVEGFNMKINSKNVKSIVEINKIDTLVFCIGSTDEQMDLSQALRGLKGLCTVIFSWLEEGGRVGYTLTIPQNSNGCYKCLKEKANIIFPYKTEKKVNSWLKNGCGAVRTKYGNRTLLTATNGFLYAFEKSKQREEPYIVSSDIEEGIKEHKLISNGCEYCDTL